MDSFGRLGANRSHSRRYGEDLQRRMVDEDAISCKRFGETKFWGRPTDRDAEPGLRDHPDCLKARREAEQRVTPSP